MQRPCPPNRRSYDDPPDADGSDDGGAWHWADGKPCDAEGPARIGHEWIDLAAATNALLETKQTKCVYVDMQQGYKWGVADCDSTDVDHLLCERVEDSCTSNRNVFKASGGCGAADEKSGATGNGVCLNQPGMLYYCVCPAGEQLMLPSGGATTYKNDNSHHCTKCPGAGATCTFALEGKRPNEKWSVSMRHRAEQVLRSFTVPVDRKITEISVTAMLSIWGDGTPPCPYTDKSVYVRHVDALTDGVTNCFDDTGNDKLVYRFKAQCQKDPPVREMGQGEARAATTDASNPCLGKTAGRIELVGYSPGANRRLLVVNPTLTVDTRPLAEANKCEAATSTSAAAGTAAVTKATTTQRREPTGAAVTSPRFAPLTPTPHAQASAAYTRTCNSPDTSAAMCVCDGTTYDFSQIQPTDDNPYFSAPDQDNEYMYYFQVRAAHPSTHPPAHERVCVTSLNSARERWARV